MGRGLEAGYALTLRGIDTVHALATLLHFIDQRTPDSMKNQIAFL